MPNLGRYDDPPSWDEIIKYFRGSELQNYFVKMTEADIKAVIKPQYVDNLPRAIKGPVQKVGDLLKLRIKDKGEEYNEMLIKDLQLYDVLEREISKLSGGELQRFAIAMACVQSADIYMFDEPSSYLDVKQRLKAAHMIRSLLAPTVYVIAVEHDLSVLDYLSDFVCIIYGVPSVYGVVTMPSSVREGINIFLDGHIPSENIRFREDSLQFRLADSLIDNLKIDDGNAQFTYPEMTKTQGDFKLTVEAGDFNDSEILVLMGENGTGKTTLIKLLAGVSKSDKNETEQLSLNVSMKPQKIAPRFPGTVRQLFFKKIRGAFLNPQFQTDVVKPLKIDNIIDNEVQTLSGGELQRVAIILSLGVVAQIYLIDEPSAYLDSEQRVICAKVIRRFVLHNKKTAFVVEHDFIMATYLADRVIVFEGTPAKAATAKTPESLVTGCNRFLKSLNVTFRRDPSSFRPRINKLGSQMDQEQKSSGNYFFLEGTI
ncbi:P-loop containing nucleoside triphosphate hydrolase protein [Hanseniaspora valbyensis NRRL Y-1626]|uniref:p-loop containing nucleoside triphosphate hydrolase protein n=1 Tax=Hanseniaspora valbyensis NRRL Y-1626 TaxID=766949 RepID=A0A1B7T7N2_9ASCO|nr:P-loop containing nucleoside triphosphate hydrolase protein [Hanseniaspora valbyensis NRRL Y-1626]